MSYEGTQTLQALQLKYTHISAPGTTAATTALASLQPTDSKGCTIR